MTVRYEPRLCDKSPCCPVVRICPKGAFHMDRQIFRPSFDMSRCAWCGICVPSRPRREVAEE